MSITQIITKEVPIINSRLVISALNVLAKFSLRQ